MEKLVKTMSTLISSWNMEEIGTSNPHHNLLQAAIVDFQEFSNDYEDYFENIIENKLYDPAKITEQRLRYRYTQTLQNYWSSLEQVILQWQVEYYRTTLQQAHDRATQYLQNLNLPLSGILIYLNKVATIRYLPFTRIPILGIPRLFSGEERWSAIPHEIGHYVFWNLGPNLRETQQLQKQLKADVLQSLIDYGINEQQRTFVIPWLEEIFCDVVGTRVDGSVFISSSDEFVRTQAGNENDLTLNDGHHPPLVIRPFVWYRAQKHLNRKAGRPKLETIFDIASVANFKKFKIQTSSPILTDRVDITTPGIGLFGHEFETLQVSELLAAVDLVVDSVSEKLGGILPAIHIELRKASAFQELKDLITFEKESESKFKDEEIYEILLKPRALEEGYTHTHGINTFHGWHESTTHSH